MRVPCSQWRYLMMVDLLTTQVLQSNMSTGHVHITPEQIAAVTAGNGIAHIEDPTTRRIYLLVEQGQAPTLSDDYFREKIAVGIAEADRGECQLWDVDQLKADLRRRHVAKPRSGDGI